MVKEIKGDLFMAREDVLIHGCNCFCTMGAGVARIVKEKYPNAYYADQMTDIGDKRKLGNYSYWSGKHWFHEKKITIINAYTQYNFKKKEGEIDYYVDYSALETVMTRIDVSFPKLTISMPKIGAGLAGGDWNKIKEILNRVFKNREVVVYIID